MVNELVVILIVSILVQMVVDQIKKVVKLPKGYNYYSINFKVLLSVIVSIFICLCGNVQLLALLDIQLVMPFVDSIITGVIISGGANVIHDLIQKINELKS